MKHILPALYILGITLKAFELPILASVSWVAVLAWYPAIAVVILVVLFALAYLIQKY